MTVTIDEEVRARFQAVAAPDEDFAVFLSAAAQDAIARRERQAAGAAEMQAMLEGPNRPFDAEATYRQYREKYGWPDLSHLSGDELEDHGDMLLAALPPEKQAEAERLGLIRSAIREPVPRVETRGWFDQRPGDARGAYHLDLGVPQGQRSLTLGFQPVANCPRQ